MGFEAWVIARLEGFYKLQSKRNATEAVSMWICMSIPASYVKVLWGGYYLMWGQSERYSRLEKG